MTAHQTAQTALAICRWTRQEFEKMVAVGAIDEDDHVELIDGLIVQEPLQPAFRRTVIELFILELKKAFPSGYRDCCRLPLAVY